MPSYDINFDPELAADDNARASRFLGFQLTTAVTRKQVGLVKDLLDRGADVNVSNGNLLYTALNNSDDVSEGSLVQIISDVMFGAGSSKRIEVLRGLGYSNLEIFTIAKTTFKQESATEVSQPRLSDIQFD